ncbi:hypothetical protein [Terriglobus sp. ADX1]|uniref:hypothetical protein n=1 Tax=Terriglobus sp. ADX1 TaxID=2794063 RepID=UPI002FE59434
MPIGQIKGMIAADAAFDIGADTYENGKATLAITQKPTGSSRAIPMYFTANDQGLVTFKAVLPAGMAMKLSDAGNYVCGKWLDKLQAGNRGETLAGRSEKLDPVIEPKSVLSTAQLTSNCEANFTTKGAMFPGGYQYGSLGVCVSKIPL